MADHVDDVHRLLSAMTDQPVHMLGCSFGAAIGLRLAVEHPGRLATLIAHEPVVPSLLPTAAERVRHVRELKELQDLYRERGLADAVVKIAEVLGIDPAAQDTEPGLTPFPLDDRRRAGFDFFIRNDFTAIVRDTLDIAALRDTPVRVVPAFGRTTPRHVFDYRCARELAALLGVEAREFPGGHNGNTTHPRAYAARVRELLPG
ncbi:hypothetical protein GCM10027161_60830 [Microbispora hainanensis]|nr:alpha/beta hydrolase [Microbispora hainanensis]